MTLQEIINSLTEAERELVSSGEMCPRCKSKLVTAVGSVPDGMNLNVAYNCVDCDAQWEGY